MLSVRRQHLAQTTLGRLGIVQTIPSPALRVQRLFEMLERRPVSKGLRKT
jgi:hypothetical protein